MNYNASKLHWDNIEILEKNEPLINANITFNDIEHVSKTDKIVEPTCINEGYTVYECSCGMKFVRNIVDKLPHNYEALRTEPTCEETGKIIYNCSCGESYTEIVEANGHIVSNWIIDFVPTCISEGLKHIECAVCEEIIKNETIAKLPHSYNSVITEATCESDGYTTYTCVCGDTYTGDNTAAKGHSYTEGVCTVCGESKIENCSCNCHKSGFMGFIWKLLNFFQKLFKTNPTCACGAAHY